MSAKFQASIRRVSDAHDELALARKEQHEIVTDYFVACGGHVRREDHTETCPDGGTLLVNSEAEELVVKAGDKSTVIFLNKIGTVRVESGDGSLVVFEEEVGGANINQGHGSDVFLHEAPDSLDINQGAGSTVALTEEDD